MEYSTNNNIVSRIISFDFCNTVNKFKTQCNVVFEAYTVFLILANLIPELVLPGECDQEASIIKSKEITMLSYDYDSEFAIQL